MTSFFCTILLLSHRYSISVPFIVIHMRTKNRLFIHSFIHSFIRSFIHSTIHSAFNNPKICKTSFFFLISGRKRAHDVSSWSSGTMLLSAPVFGLPTVFLYLFFSPPLSLLFYSSMWLNHLISMLQNQVVKEEWTNYLTISMKLLSSLFIRVWHFLSCCRRLCSKYCQVCTFSLFFLSLTLFLLFFHACQCVCVCVCVAVT